MYTQPFINSLTHSFTPSFIHSFTHAFTHSLTHSFYQSLTHSLMHSFFYSLTHSFIRYSFIHSLTHSLTHSFIRTLLHMTINIVKLIRSGTFQNARRAGPLYTAKSPSANKLTYPLTQFQVYPQSQDVAFDECY